MSGGETVRVIVRCRPMNQRETNLNCQTIVTMNTKLNQVILTNLDESNEPPKQFTFDAVYPEDSITENIYPESVFPLVESVLEGYNGTVFAYGQTGCGKSFTMQGLNIPGSPQRGIIPRSFEHVFEASGVTSGTKFLIRASYLEIYNETIRDLLGKDIKAALDLKEFPDKGVQVSGLSWHECMNMIDCERLMDRGNRNRATGATLMNKDSSRSHSIFTILVEMCSKNELTGKDHIRTGKLNLVDLAGSERQSKTQAEGERLREATRINLSLSALGNVISALVDGKSKHIPYRDSKLTRLLQDSLGGNTKTLMVAAVSPAHDNYDETLSTLRYANRAKNIKNKPKVNEDPRDAMMKQLQDEILRLKQELSSAGIGGSSSNLTDPPIDRNSRDDEIEREKERLREEYEREVSEIRKQFENERLTKEEIQKKYEDLKLQYDCDVELLNSNKSDTRQQQQQSQEYPQDRQQGQSQEPGQAPGQVPGQEFEQGQSQGTVTDGERSKQRRKSAKPKPDRTGQGQNENNENKPRTSDQMTIEEKLERLNQLEKKLVGGELINNEETKKKRKKKLNEMRERQEKKRKEFAALANDDDVLFKVFDQTQEQFHTAIKHLEEEKLNVRRLENDNKDLQSEFERERQLLLDTIRGHTQHILLLETMMQRMSELIPSSCNYRDYRRVLNQANYDEDKNIYILPPPMKQETNLPRFQNENIPTMTRGRNEQNLVRLDPTGSPNAEYEADFDEPTEDQGDPTDFIQFDELERRHARNTDVESLVPERSRTRRQEQLLNESSALQRSKRPLQMNNSDADYMNRRLNPFEPSTRLARRYGFSTDKP